MATVQPLFAVWSSLLSCQHCAAQPFFFHLCAVQIPVSTAAPDLSSWRPPLRLYGFFWNVVVRNTWFFQQWWLWENWAWTSMLIVSAKGKRPPSPFHPVHHFLAVLLSPTLPPQFPLGLCSLFITPFSHLRCVIIHLVLNLFIVAWICMRWRFLSFPKVLILAE